MFDSTIERYFGASRYKRGLVPALLLLLVLICSVCVNAQDSPGVHIVQPGETLWSISRQYGLDMETLALVNDLSNPNSIRVGQKLIVSVSQSVEYTVQRGDSLWAISAAFGVSVDDIVRVNRITNPSKIKAGQVLTIPLGVGGVGVTPYIEYSVTRGDTLWDIAKAYNISVDAVLAANPGVVPTKLKVGDVIKVPLGEYARSLGSTTVPRYIWPVSGGRITSEYGWRTDPFTRQRSFHGGIDIGLPEGSPIYASAAGVVLEAGPKGNYGNAVVIQHEDGLVTLYAHASKVLVKKGQRVVQGQLIARVGSTGRATGPHLHFEVRKNDVTIDPRSIVTAGK